MKTISAFEWNPAKAAGNLAKHGVAFEEAKTVFEDPMFITFVDDEHSVDEERYITVGISGRGRLLVVAHTHREERIRIISARKATKKEVSYYEKAD